MMKLHKSTTVKKFLLTLTKIEIVSPTLTFKDIGSMINSIEKGAKLYGVKERHADGTSSHYHVIIILKDGLSKNTYRTTFRDMFTIFKGRGLDVQGIKNMTNAVAYILKIVPNIEDIFIVNSSLEELFKLAKMEELATYYSMKKFDRFDEWKHRSVSNRQSFYKSFKKIKLIWDDCQADKVSPLASIVPRLDTSIFIGLDKQNLGYDVIRFLLKFCRIIFFPHEWKRTNILLVGKPNCGKTTFFKKFEDTFNTELFWASVRVGDFSGFSNKHGLIVLDDVIRKGHKWPIAILLKLLGSEGFKGDVKIASMITIKKGVPVVVVTNYDNNFNSGPIKARLAYCRFRRGFNWLDISNEEFKSMVSLFRDMVFNLKTRDEKLYNKLNYVTDFNELTNNKEFTNFIKHVYVIVNNCDDKRANEEWNRFKYDYFTDFNDEY